jgi:phospholipase A1
MRNLFLLTFFLLVSFGAKAQGLFARNVENYSLSERWHIHDTLANKKDLFRIETYKPVYILLANYTSDINEQPTSENPDNVVPQPLPLDDTELKFQISFKTKAIRNLFGKRVGGDIWIGYSQTSRWQIYNVDQSRPFRETNYEPELMLIIPTPYKIFGLNGVFAGIGFNHQSNGRSNPLSRSWNRVILQFGWETKDFSVVLRPWWRLQEEPIEDNNPGIENYIGRGDLLVAYEKGRHDLSLIGRHSLKGGENNRGSIQFDYAYRVYDFLKLHLQVFHGYGESLIDYNHKQTTVGLGVSLVEWR